MVPAIEAMNAGDVDVTYGSISAAIGALAGNSDFKIFAIERDQPDNEGIIAARRQRDRERRRSEGQEDRGQQSRHRRVPCAARARQSGAEQGRRRVRLPAAGRRRLRVRLGSGRRVGDVVVVHRPGAGQARRQDGDHRRRARLAQRHAVHRLLVVRGAIPDARRGRLPRSPGRGRLDQGQPRARRRDCTPTPACRRPWPERRSRRPRDWSRSRPRSTSASRRSPNTSPREASCRARSTSPTRRSRRSAAERRRASSAARGAAGQARVPKLARYGDR